MCMCGYVYEHARKLCGSIQLQPSHSRGSRVFPTTEDKISVQIQDLDGYRCGRQTHSESVGRTVSATKIRVQKASWKMSKL